MGEYPEGKKMCWETLSEVRDRMRRVSDRYADYDKVIFVCHAMAFKALAYIEDLRPADIVECNYSIGRKDCENLLQ